VVNYRGEDINSWNESPEAGLELGPGKHMPVINRLYLFRMSSEECVSLPVS
jgi:hypothetical protein